MNQLMSGQQLPYGNKQSYNIRDSSVSNNSNCGSSLAAYTGAGKQSQNFGMLNNFMSSGLQQAFYPQQ